MTKRCCLENVHRTRGMHMMCYAGQLAALFLSESLHAMAPQALGGWVPPIGIVRTQEREWMILITLPLLGRNTAPRMIALDDSAPDIKCLFNNQLKAHDLNSKMEPTPGLRDVLAEFHFGFQLKCQARTFEYPRLPSPRFRDVGNRNDDLIFSPLHPCMLTKQEDAISLRPASMSQ